MKPEQLASIRTIPAGHTVVLSHDTRYIAFVSHTQSDDAPPAGGAYPSGAPFESGGTSLMVAELATGESFAVADNGARSWRPAWSPSRTALAFFADHRGVVELWLWDADSRASRPVDGVVVHPSSFGDGPVWSPSGDSIYVLVRTEGWQPSHDEPRLVGPQLDVLVSPADDVAGGSEGGGLAVHQEDLRDVARVELSSGAMTRLLRSAPVEEIGISAEGTWLALRTCRVQPSVTSWAFAQDLELLSLATCEHRVLARALSATSVLPPLGWAPSGSRIAWIQDGALRLADANEAVPHWVEPPVPLDESFLLWHPEGQGLLVRDTGGVLLYIALQGTVHELGWPSGRRLPATVLDTAARPAFWSPDGSSATVVTTDEASQRGEVWTVPLDGSPPVLRHSEDAWLAATSPKPVYGRFGDAREDVVVFSAEHETRPADLFVTGSGFAPPRRLTTLNPQLANASCGKVRRLGFTTLEGERLYASLLLPADDRGNPSPLVVQVYPGYRPESTHRWSRLDLGVVHHQVLAAEGFAVLVPELPGVPGRAPSAARLASVVLSAVNAAVDAGHADPDRLGLMGQSAGGLCVNLLLTHTDRFAAAVSCAAPADAASMFGELAVLPDGRVLSHGVHNEIGRLGGAPWEVPLRYISGSPVFALNRITTPLLLVHGTGDRSVDVAQSGEMFVGLRSLGKTVTFLRYREEGHVPTRFTEANRMDVTQRILDWFMRYL